MDSLPIKKKILTSYRIYNCMRFLNKPDGDDVITICLNFAGPLNEFSRIPLKSILCLDPVTWGHLCHWCLPCHPVLCLRFMWVKTKYFMNNCAVRRPCKMVLHCGFENCSIHSCSEMLIILKRPAADNC